MTLQKKAFAAALFAAVFTTAAGAKCVPNTRSNANSLARVRPMMLKAPAAFARPADPPPGQEPSVAGLWSVQFTVDGQVVDEGFDMWHNDGTELLNDAVTPSSGAVCVGVWTKTAPFTYSLKHPSYVFDDANVNLIGVAILRETIVLDPSGSSYTGDLTIDVYDLMGNQVDHETARIAGMRISVDDDPKQSTGIPGLPVFANQ